MQTITLTRPWTYRTPLKTIAYPAGEHEITKEVAAQAEAEGVLPGSGGTEGTDNGTVARAPDLPTSDTDARRFASAAVKKRKIARDG